ncbi:MAG: lysophospholipid acyltransferase family protein [Alphaproteobacteria bacterium]
MRAGARLIVWLAWTFLLLPLQLLALALGQPDRIPLIYHRGVLRIFGISIDKRGVPSPSRPTLFVSNHASYLDIEALGALVAGSFVAKSEVSSWPLFGLLARLQRSVFIERRRSRAAGHRAALAARLDDGDSIILFAEGTSSDGRQVLAFKSALFAVADRARAVQPVSIAYTRLNGAPLPGRLRPEVAWYGDMELAGHLWNFLGLGALTLVVEFHPTVAARDFPSRKALADHCQRIVAGGLSRALRGSLTPRDAVVPSEPVEISRVCD